MYRRGVRSISVGAVVAGIFFSCTGESPDKPYCTVITSGSQPPNLCLIFCGQARTAGCINEFQHDTCLRECAPMFQRCAAESALLLACFQEHLSPSCDILSECTAQGEALIACNKCQGCALTSNSCEGACSGVPFREFSSCTDSLDSAPISCGAICTVLGMDVADCERDGNQPYDCFSEPSCCQEKLASWFPGTP